MDKLTRRVCQPHTGQRAARSPSWQDTSYVYSVYLAGRVGYRYLQLPPPPAAAPPARQCWGKGHSVIQRQLRAPAATIAKQKRRQRIQQVGPYLPSNSMVGRADSDRSPLPPSRTR